MPNGIFTQRIETQPAAPQAISPVTASPTAAAISGIAPFVQTAAEVGIAFHEQDKLQTSLGEVSDELKGLDKQFSSYAQAVQSGQNKGALQMRARAALKSAVAASPILKSQAEALYANYFGGAGTGGTGTSGAFSLSPEEEQAKKIQAEISDYTLLGYSQDYAETAVRAKREAEVAKTKAETLANKSKVKLYEVAPLVDKQLLGTSVNFQTTLQQNLESGGGTLTADTRLSMGRDIDIQLVKDKKRLLQSVTDPQTGRMTISNEAYQGMVTKLENQAKSFKQLLKDNSAQQYLADVAATKDSEAQVIAYETLPQISVLRKAGGDQFVNKWLDATMTGNTKMMKWLEARNPEFADMLNGNYAVRGKITVKAASKLFDEETPTPITETESALVGDSMAGNAQLAMDILEKAGAGKLGGITQYYPPALASTFTPTTQSFRTTRASSIKENVRDMQNGVVTRFAQEFRNNFGRFPGGVEIIVGEPDMATVLSSKRPYANMANIQSRISVNLASGEQMPQEMVNMVADMVRSVRANPEAIPDALKDKGLKPEEIVSLWVNSGLPADQLQFYAPMTEIVSAAKEEEYSYQTQKPQPASAPAGSKMGAGDTRGDTTKGKEQPVEEAPIEEEPLTAGDLPSDKVIREVKRLKAEGYSLEFLLASFDQYNMKGERSVVRQQIETAYDLPVAGYDN